MAELILHHSFSAGGLIKKISEDHPDFSVKEVLALVQEELARQTLSRKQAKYTELEEMKALRLSREASRD